VFLNDLPKLIENTGRSLGVLPRSIASEGYLDLDRDDQKEGDFVTGLEREAIAASEARRAQEMKM
jgi:hypothetical protein